MPIYDLQCKKCGNSKIDELLTSSEEVVLCELCDNEMEKKMGGFSFTFIPAGITTHKKRFGNSVPDNYKTTGGANIYSKPRP